MNISIISAMTLNKVIGLKNRIPWQGNLPADLFWFKEKTLNKTIIMGYKTFKSIGKPLSKRINIVLSYHHYIRNETYIKHAKTLNQALSLAENTSKEIMIIGGSKIYEIFLPKATKLYITTIFTKIRGDSFFPEYLINKKEWKLIFSEFHTSDKNNLYNFKFEILERLK